MHHVGNFLWTLPKFCPFLLGHPVYYRLVMHRNSNIKPTPLSFVRRPAFISIVTFSYIYIYINTKYFPNERVYNEIKCNNLIKINKEKDKWIHKTAGRRNWKVFFPTLLLICCALTWRKVSRLSFSQEVGPWLEAFSVQLWCRWSLENVDSPKNLQKFQNKILWFSN